MNELKEIKIINSLDLINIDIHSVYNNKLNSRSIPNNNYFCIATSNVGYRGVAGSLNNNGLWYTNNGGKNWIISETHKTGTFSCICINSNGNFAVAGSNISNGLWYSIDSGINWKYSNINSKFNSIVVNTDGTIIIGTSNSGIYYSLNSGNTWQLSLLYPNNQPLPRNPVLITISGNYTSIVLSPNGLIGVAGSNTKPGLIYSFNSGNIWYTSTVEKSINVSEETSIFTTSHFNTLAISSNGSNVIAGSSSNTGLWYSFNGGVTWRQSETSKSGSFYTISISSVGTHAMAADTNNNIWYSNDRGINWRRQKIISTFTNSSGIYPSFYNSSLWYRSPSNISWKPSNIVIPWIRTYTNTSGDFFPVRNLAIELRNNSQLIQIQMMVYTIGQMVDIAGEKKIQMKCLFLLL